MAVIVCPQPQAAEIGLDVMRRGGNAIDAAVTCAFVQGVIDPQMCGIGGCGVMLVHSPQSGDSLLEFYSTAGSRVREDQWEPIFIREARRQFGDGQELECLDDDTRWGEQPTPAAPPPAGPRHLQIVR